MDQQPGRMEDSFRLLIATLCGVSTGKAALADTQANYLGLFRTASARSPFGAGAADALITLFYKLTNGAESPKQAVTLILDGTFDTDPPPGFPVIAYSKLTRSLAFLVLTGGWHPDCVDTSSADDATIPSPAAYTSGMVWLIAQAHAQGYSRDLFGSWASPPDPLSSFTGV